MILSFQSIVLRCHHQQLIQPWAEQTTAFGMTFGAGPCGYDVRIARETDGRGVHILRPGKFTLASTVEHFNMPNDLVAQVCDKSTWARRGLCVQNTIIEPGWRGFLTLELTNHGQHIIVIEPGMPIAQIVFAQLDEPTMMPYDGKYQDQPRGAVPAIMEGS